MAQVRQNKTVTVSNNQTYVIVVIALIVISLLLGATVFTLISRQNNQVQSQTSSQSNSDNTAAAMTYCTEQTKRYAKTDEEFRMGVRGCMERDPYVKGLLGK